ASVASAHSPFASVLGIAGDAYSQPVLPGRTEVAADPHWSVAAECCSASPPRPPSFPILFGWRVEGRRDAYPAGGCVVRPVQPLGGSYWLNRGAGRGSGYQVCGDAVGNEVP